LFIYILLCKIRQQTTAGQEFFIQEKFLDTIYGTAVRGACSKMKKIEIFCGIFIARGLD